ncbi:MAG: sigma-70 family RNA polymerase sigma factor [Deltaproteobacteria bacterium HGW-Deltaproteobacteria-20]|jgi:RNA polymerase sigma-70 factor (ECF subfamily)|nr:MAG: sigma-70 family RNA polymerase sigma factor [Deltaproteobacteria bacterium HGW-Deltaproteobacteria-20]
MQRDLSSEPNTASSTSGVRPRDGQVAGSTHVRLRTIAEAHYDFIWRLLRRLGVSADATDDATQEVFMVAMRRVEDIQTGAERSFLFGVALRVASDRRRAQARCREVVTDVEPEGRASAPGPDELTDQRRAREALDELLAAMPEDLRVVFVLYELEGMTTGQIADLAGIPVGTAASRLRRARDEFRQLVQRFRAKRDGLGGVR